MLTSNHIVIIVIISIIVAALWVISCWDIYFYGHRQGYNKCLTNIRAKKRIRRRPSKEDDIRVLQPVSGAKRHYAEAESVRIVATRPPRHEEDDAWF